jgi:hypothetical protein
MFDSEKYRPLQEWPISIEHTRPLITYVASDGTKFSDLRLLEIYERPLQRQRYYDYLMKKRNWFQRFFNLKPDMSFYDSIVLKSMFTK